MTNEPNNQIDIERLRAVLDIYGADAGRWPEAERDALERLAREDRRAGELLADAAGLERVMALAPAGAATEDLERRIVAAAVADGAREARIVPLDAGARRTVTGGLASRVAEAWPAALLAASFFLGLYIGTADLVPRLIEGSLEIAELNGAGEDSEDLFGGPVSLGAGRGSVL